MTWAAVSTLKAKTQSRLYSKANEVVNSSSTQDEKLLLWQNSLIVYIDHENSRIINR